MPADRFLHPKCGHSHKVNLLTDLEYRVWTQYLMSADDFGVMRCSAVTIQADNDHLANRTVRQIDKALEVIIKSGLVRAFTHQGRRYLYQPNWQVFQKVEYPRATDNPKPDEDAMTLCDELTAALFLKHPGGTRSARASRERPEGVPNDLEKSATTRACVPAKRLTANGQRLVANGSEGGLGETDDGPPLPRLLLEFTARYPAQGRCANHLSETAFFEVVGMDARGPAVAYAELCQRLEGHIRSHQWRVKKMIPRLDNYLRSGLHLQELPEELPQANGSRTAGNADALRRFVDRGQAS